MWTIAPPAVHHRGSLRRQHRRGRDVHVEHALPHRAIAGEPLVLEVGGRADDAVEPSEAVDRRRDQSVEVGILRDVGRHESSRVTQPFRGGGAVFAHRGPPGRPAHRASIRTAPMASPRNDAAPVTMTTRPSNSPTRARLDADALVLLAASYASRATSTSARSLTSGTPTSHQHPPPVQVVRRRR